MATGADFRAIAFMPWVSIGHPARFGKVKLIPFQRNRTPGSLHDLSQGDIDDILGVYTESSGRAIASATIVETTAWRSGSDPRRSMRTLFRMRDMMTFAALAH